MIVNEEARSKAWTIWEIGQTEEQYNKMLQDMRELEKQYDAVLCQLPDKQRDIICDFVSGCEGMSWRMLEIACALMEFPSQE